jgi:PAS domain S-box-containing protein
MVKPEPGPARATVPDRLASFRTDDRTDDRYRLLFESALDAILVLDDHDACIDINPATVALLGRTREELIGRSMTELVVDGEPRFDGAWKALVADGRRTRAARGYVRLRRADGTICEVEYSAVASIGPGTHLAILRDATERRTGERLALLREAILDALGTLPTDASAPDLATVACRAMVEHSGFPEIAVLLAEPPDRIELIGAAVGDGMADVALPRAIDGTRATTILARAETGAWVDDWSGPDGQPNETLVEGLSIRSVAWAPIRAEGRVVALLAVGGSLAAADLQPSLPYLIDLATIVAGSTLGRSLREQSTLALSRQRIQAIVDESAFRPVFQPIVDLESGEILAYEALTRFADGTAPDVLFAEAARTGLSMALEAVTARAALEAASPLPANRAIHINVSPELILAGEPLRGMLRDWGFGVILEVTEHSPISDYAAVRAAVATMGPDVRLAIDDAGAGFASLRHILELRPSVVKLDISLIRGIDADLPRQALVAGMVHFAARMSFVLLAEGVETTAERATLQGLGVRHAQGYLFGRPAELGELGGA